MFAWLARGAENAAAEDATSLLAATSTGLMEQQQRGGGGWGGVDYRSREADRADDADAPPSTSAAAVDADFEPEVLLVRTRRALASPPPTRKK
jgi:hypothetical protein